MKNANSAKMLLVLTGFAIVVGAILALAYQGFYPRIEANRIAEERRAIFSVLEKAKDYKTIEYTRDGGEVVKIFEGMDAGGNTVGYAFLTSGPGFSATIKIMVGINLDRRKLTGMKVVEHLETPGLGTKIEGDKFTVQFKGLAFEPKIEYLKGKKPEKSNQIQTITGATISSVAIVKAMNRRMKIVLEILEGGGS